MRELLEKYSASDPLLGQFILYAVKGSCVRKCKEDTLPPNLRDPDPEFVEEFRRCVPYSYLHYAYYQV